MYLVLMMATVLAFTVVCIVAYNGQQEDGHR